MRSLLFAVLALGLASAALAQDLIPGTISEYLAGRELRVVALVGQSNMTGTAPASGDDLVANERVLAAYMGDHPGSGWWPWGVNASGGKFARLIGPAVEPLHNGGTGAMGPALVMGKDLAAAWGPGVVTLLYPMAKGDTPLSNSDPTTNQYFPGLRQLQQIGRVVAIAYLQGEYEAMHSPDITQAERAADLDAWLAQWRLSLNDPALPLVTATLTETLPQTTYPAQDAINGALLDWPTRDPLVYCASSAGAAANKQHYLHDGYVEMGHRLAAGLLTLVP